MTREAFGPNLRRLRLQHGVSVHQIAEATKVSVALWEGLERNDFRRWPAGIFARAYVREYARWIGADPEATVDEFCRSFPVADRRSRRLLREHAEIVGHTFESPEEIPPAVESDRRGSLTIPEGVRTPPSAFMNLFVRLRRTFGKA